MSVWWFIVMGVGFWLWLVGLMWSACWVAARGDRDAKEAAAERELEADW